MDEDVGERRRVRKPGLLSSHEIQPFSDTERDSPPRIPSFGKFLEVSTSPRAPVFNQSRSVSTDEGIFTEDNVSHVSRDYTQRGNPVAIKENHCLIGVHQISCTCCFRTFTHQFHRGVFPICGLFGEPRQKIFRIKSEDAPRTRQPNADSAPTIRVRCDVNSYQRKMFGNKGHSNSDARVSYEPVLTEFTGVKNERHVRKLPQTPNAAKSLEKPGNDSELTCCAELQETYGGKVFLLPPASKPRLCRQRREYSTDSMLYNFGRTASLEFEDSSAQNTIRRHNERSNSINSCKSRKLSNSEIKSQVQSCVVIDDKSKCHVLSISGRAKNIVRDENSIKPVKGPSQSDTFDESCVPVDPDDEGDSTDVENLGKSKSGRVITTRELLDSAPRKEDSIINTRQGNGKTESLKKKDHQSFAERLMAIGPTDQRRVQCIVQDVLFEMGEERILQYKSAFAKFDKDSSGIISSKQLRRLLRTLGHNPGDDELRELVNQVDMDENGKIDFNEFIIMIG